MVKINVLLENYSIDKKFKSKHGFSILIEHEGKSILLDVGPDSNFSKNASQFNINLANVEYLFLSHNHSDHVGGINKFMEINNSAKVYLMDSIYNKYYIKLLFFHIPIGLKMSKKYNSRITQIKNDFEVNNKTYFLKNSISKYLKPTFNKKLYKKDSDKIKNDTFDHEGILVLEDNDELLIFNSCSHNGILNVIESVKIKFPNKKIRSYIGGLHLYNPTTKINDSDEYLDYLIKELNEMDIIVYTGHCTGKYALNYMKEKLGDKIQEINTGMVLDI